MRITKILITVILTVLCFVLVPVMQALAVDLPPEPPVGLQAVSSNNSIALSWTANTENDLKGYYIYGKEKGTFGFLKLSASLTTDNSYTDMVVIPGVTYVYYVTAVDREGSESQSSNEVEAAIVTTPDYSDVPDNAWYRLSVNRLVSEKVLSGYNDGTFRPGQPITRAEFVKMLSIAMKWTATGQESIKYSDVRGSYWAYSYIAIGSARGALAGYKDGTFKPTRNISREETAKIVAIAAGLSTGSSKLNDVSSSWAKAYIGSCASAGIITGYADNSFRPRNLVTRAEAAAMLVRMLDYK